MIHVFFDLVYYHRHETAHNNVALEKDRNWAAHCYTLRCVTCLAASSERQGRDGSTLTQHGGERSAARVLSTQYSSLSFGYTR